MKIREVMTPDAKVVSPRQSLREAAKLMAECDAGSLPVGEDDRLVGMITDRDIVIRGLAQGLSPDSPIREAMSKEVLYCFEDQDPAHVAQNMSEQKVRRLPVLNREKRLVGIVSLGDIARAVKSSKAGGALAEIAQPGGPHDQTLALH